MGLNEASVTRVLDEAKKLGKPIAVHVTHVLLPRPTNGNVHLPLRYGYDPSGGGW